MKTLTRALALYATFALLAASTPAAPGNQLKNHPSPYLAMHGNDPVAWKDWAPVALAQAKREGKLVFVSIGYFACHWCHVMQRESYQNAEIAAFLNKHFVSVKVDRELEPALDARMIAFAEATRGAAGWPLNVFLTPEGHSLYAVLYEPPQDFFGVLQRLQKLWTEDRAKLTQLARQEAVKASGPGKPVVDRAQAQRYGQAVVAGALSLADMIHGGFGEQSKFPSVPQLDFLLSQYAATKHAKVGEFLTLTLNQMAAVGLHDHLGGGFYRYTVDQNWKTPHFEKMLYDNALLARLYLRAARVMARPEYEALARRTLDFMTRELRDPSGALIASLSAVDEQGVEGGYYLWQKPQLAALLTPAERALFEAAWNLTDPPPFEDGYVPLADQSPAELAKRLGLSEKDVKEQFAQGARKLLAARAKRSLPRDTKLLAAWNALALSAYAEAARVLKEDAYRAAAQEVRDYIARTLWTGKALHRAVHAGNPIGAAGLEDYAYVARAMFDYAMLTGADEDYALATAIAEAGWARLYDKNGWRLGQSVIAGEPGQDIVADGPMPSPSAVLAETTLALAARTGNKRLRERAQAALNSGHALLKTDPFWYATHIDAMLVASAPR